MGSKNTVLKKKELIDGKYTVSFFIKKGSYAETYRVKDKENNNRFLKLIDYSCLRNSQLTKDMDVSEISILKNLSHPNIVEYLDNGELIKDGRKYAYYILHFISGETLAEKLAREEHLNEHEAKHIVLQALEGLAYLHSQHVIHNDITIKNLMIDLSTQAESIKLIDFGHARSLTQKYEGFHFEGLDYFYAADELLNGVFSVSSDIYAVGTLYYHLLEGMPPYFIDNSRYLGNAEKIKEAILAERQKPLRFDRLTDENTKLLIKKALSQNAKERFNSPLEFIKAVNGELELLQEQKTPDSIVHKAKKSKAKGAGFSPIAGMHDLKEQLYLDVIDALHNKERYEKYGLTIPNGMLLYGPPGCGKTFFAEKLAEEIGFNFYQIKPSDIQSKWVNESQEHVKNLFNEARENAPSIIFIDELDAVMPSRDTSSISHMNTATVNEFLTQMNNSGKDEVFVIGATNRPSAIDPAVRRAGRLDKHVFLPAPDYDARKELFKMYLENRPIEFGLDYDRFALITVDYVSSDIKFLCDEAARQALKLDARITNDLVFKAIAENKPSVSRAELDSYLQVKEQFES